MSDRPGIVYEYEPLECLCRVHYDAMGQLSAIDVAIAGRRSIRRHPEPGDTVGDLFESAFEANKTLLLTERVANPLPNVDHKEAGSR